MAGPLHTRRLRAAPSPSRRGHELLVLSCRKIYRIVAEGNPLVGPHQSMLLFAMTGRFEFVQPNPYFPFDIPVGVDGGHPTTKPLPENIAEAAFFLGGVGLFLKLLFPIRMEYNSLRQQSHGDGSHHVDEGVLLDRHGGEAD